MSGYSCPECGARMRHIETSPGQSRWQCTNPDDRWDCSEATAARFLKERPDDPEFEADMTKEEVVAAPAYPAGTFTVEGERSPQHPEGLTSEGERPAHVTNRPLGGDEEMAVRMEEYAEAHGIVISDSNIDAIQAQLDFRTPTGDAVPKARAKAREERQAAIEAGNRERTQRDARADQEGKPVAVEASPREPQAPERPQPTPAPQPAPKPEQGRG